MKNLVRTVFAVAGCLASTACVASIGEEVEDDKLSEEPIRDVTQALSLPTFRRVYSDGAYGFDMVTCDGTTPWALGLGASMGPFTYDGLRGLWLGSGPVPSTVKAEADEGYFLGVQAVCSNAFGVKVTASDTDGTATASCSSGKVAVGGGGTCSTGKLFRSRPSPSTQGSTPTGWIASCDSGSVTAHVTCVDESMNFDFSSCRTRRADAEYGSDSLSCPSYKVAVGAGGWCDGANVSEIGIFDTYAVVRCDEEVDMTAYVVCCEGSHID